MSPDEVLRILRRIRYSPRAGRPVAVGWIARQAGYTPHGIAHAVTRGRLTNDMARRLTPVLARILLAEQGHNATTLGRYGADDAVGRGHRRRAADQAPAPAGAPPRKRAGASHTLPNKDEAEG